MPRPKTKSVEKPFAPASTISNEPRCWVTTSRSARASKTPTASFRSSVACLPGTDRAWAFADHGGRTNDRSSGSVRTDLMGRAGVGCARSGAGRHRLVHWRHPPHERKLGTEIRIPWCPEHSGMHATQVVGSRDGMDVDDGQ